MERTERAGVVPTSVRRVVVASFVGTTIEWHGYFIYGTAALVFPALFFPGFGETAGTILSYTTFALAFWRVRWAGSPSGTTGTRSAGKPCWC